MPSRMADESTAAHEDSAWIRRLKDGGSVINQVGMPSAIIIFFLVILGAMAFGYIEFPFVTRSQFIEANAYNKIAHDTLIQNAGEQTKVLKNTSTVLKNITCELKHTDVDRLRCYRAVNEANEGAP